MQDRLKVKEEELRKEFNVKRRYLPNQTTSCGWKPADTMVKPSSHLQA